MYWRGDGVEQLQAYTITKTLYIGILHRLPMLDEYPDPASGHFPYRDIRCMDKGKARQFPTQGKEKYRNAAEGGWVRMPVTVGTIRMVFLLYR